MKNFALIILILFTLLSCNSKKESEKVADNSDKFDVLIEYIENNHDFINSPESPAAINSIEVYQMLNDNIHIIDVRSPEEFNEGRVPGAVNVQNKDLIDYFENQIDPDSFEKIMLYSKDHQESMFANGVLRMLGYTNTFNVRWGMASWNSQFAEDSWEKAISSELSGYTTDEGFPKNEHGDYPVVISEFNNGYDILRERAKKLLSKDYREFLVSAREVVDNPDKYYIVNYFPKEDYEAIHLINAVQYDQRTSLKRETELNTLPTDKTIALYCYSNSTTPIVAAYLFILGYDVVTIEYGANGFMYDKLVEIIGRSFFSENVVNDFPIETDDDTGMDFEIEETGFVVPEGGC